MVQEEEVIQELHLPIQVRNRKVEDRLIRYYESIWTILIWKEPFLSTVGMIF